MDITQKGLILNQNEKYKITNEDQGGDPSYFGFITREGYWQILQINGAIIKTYLYAVGTSEYKSNWNNRTLLTYYYYNEIP